MSELIEIWSTVGAHYHDLWVLYAVVAVGVLSFSFSETYMRTSRWVKCGLFLGFVAFALANVKSLTDTVLLQREIMNNLRLQWSYSEVLLAGMGPTDLWTPLSLHAVIDVATLVA